MSIINYENLEFNIENKLLNSIYNKYGIDNLENTVLFEECGNKLYNMTFEVNKYEKLIEDLEKAQNNYCGIGIPQVKNLLNQILDSDMTAKTLYIALEIEEININAKKWMMNSIYNKKEELILDLIEVCQENNINYGFGDSDIRGISSIVYFDLMCGQVSWHTMLDKNDYKCYGDVWDGMEYTTLSKIEKFVLNNYLNN